VKILFDDPAHNEIGTIIDFISGMKNTKENEGAIGLLTNNVFQRVDVLQYSVITALLPLKNPDLYSE
jgi:non-canonical (house-cleaning) NTP pyrophosphatase